MRTSTSRLAIRAIAVTVLYALFAGCVTIQDLDRQAALHPMQTDIAKSRRNTTDKPFPSEKLVGTWEGTVCHQEMLWSNDGSTKKFEVTNYRTEYEFRADGQFFAKEYTNGVLKNNTSGKWEYVINKNGVAELTMHGWKQPYWCIFWYNDDEAAFAFRNPDIAIKWWRNALKGVYDSSWSWNCSYKRDVYLNELWVTHHLSAGQTRGYRRECHRSPEIMKRISRIEVSNAQPASYAQQLPISSGEQIYSILACERESGNDFAYKFELELKGEKSLKSFRAVQREFREAIKEDYAESFAGTDIASLYVDFPEYRQKGDKIEGRAVVLTINVVSLKYDPDTRIGVLAVRIGANQFEEARKYIRKNIETVACDKNIALTTGEIPPAAKFYLGREEIKDGNILEIEFKTE